MANTGELQRMVANTALTLYVSLHKIGLYL